MTVKKVEAQAPGMGKLRSLVFCTRPFDIETKPDVVTRHV